MIQAAPVLDRPDAPLIARSKRLNRRLMPIFTPCPISTTRPEILNAFPVNTAILDSTGTIIAVNEAWRQFGRDNNLNDPRSCIGVNYLEVCRTASAPPDLINDLEALLSGRTCAIARWYPCHAPHGRRWFILFGVCNDHATEREITLFHIEATTLVGPGAIDVLERERPDHCVTDRLVEPFVEAALSRLLPTIVAKLQQCGPRSEQRLRPVERDEARSIAKVLTKRQLEVLLLLGNGKSNEEIAEGLSASPNTIKIHVAAIMKRLSLQTRAQAVVLGARLDASGW